MLQVSVLMPVFNAERYLELSLYSLRKQTYRNFEVVVVNDHSTDQTPVILEKVTDLRIKLITNPHRLGVAESLNIGLKHCSGNFVARHDADDISYINRLAIQVDYLE